MVLKALGSAATEGNRDSSRMVGDDVIVMMSSGWWFCCLHSTGKNGGLPFKWAADQ